MGSDLWAHQISALLQCLANEQGSNILYKEDFHLQVLRMSRAKLPTADDPPDQWPLTLEASCTQRPIQCQSKQNEKLVQVQTQQVKLGFL